MLMLILKQVAKLLTLGELHEMCCTTTDIIIVYIKFVSFNVNNSHLEKDRCHFESFLMSSLGF